MNIVLCMKNYCLIYHAIYACAEIVVLPVVKLRSRWNALVVATVGSTSINVFKRPNLNLPVSSFAAIFAAVRRPLLVFVGGGSLWALSVFEVIFLVCGMAGNCCGDGGRQIGDCGRGGNVIGNVDCIVGCDSLGPGEKRGPA